MNCNYGGSPYRDKDDEELEKREEEFYRNILGLKESYADSLDMNYKDKEAKSLEEKALVDKQKLRGYIKNNLKGISLIAGSSIAGTLLFNYSVLKISNDRTVSYSSAIISGLGLGLVCYGVGKAIRDFYLSLKR